MPSQTDRTADEIDWPPELARTPAAERSTTHKFSVTFRQAVDGIEKELEDRLGVDDWRLSTAAPHRKKDGMPYANANPSDPTVVVRWSMDGDQFAVAADQHTNWRDNAREIGLWIREKRKMSNRPVKTAESEFATARLPRGDEDDAVVVAAAVDDREPHEVLGVAPDAPASVIRGAARGLIKEHHPDRNGGGGDRRELERVQEARDEMLEGDR